MKGLFVAIEGIEGAGKTTQAKLLERKLKEAGYDVLRTREPGGTWLGERVRRLLLYSPEEMCPEAELALYLSARAQLVKEVIIPALKNGKFVIADRFVHSTLAYQGYGRGLSLRELRRMLFFFTGGILPDITFLIDISPEKGLNRVKGSDRFESLSLDFHRKVRRGYLEMARQKPFQMKIINGDMKIEEISEIIFEETMNFWRKRYGACRT